MKRCLIVDDSSVIRKVAERILAGPEMLVGEAATAREAIAICSREMPDIAVVDSMLPDMDSVELIRRLTELDPQARPHLLLCACELDLGRITRAKRAGACGYVMKPFTRPQLLESFREHRLAA